MNKPYYQDELVTIYNGDCREILPELPDNCVDLVLTDPPYGISFSSVSNWYALTKQQGKLF
jgi:site-specific DNA-methyltransferase (adenine-specific)